jgi:hypothetical protein
MSAEDRNFYIMLMDTTDGEELVKMLFATERKAGIPWLSDSLLFVQAEQQLIDEQKKQLQEKETIRLEREKLEADKIQLEKEKQEVEKGKQQAIQLERARLEADRRELERERQNVEKLRQQATEKELISRETFLDLQRQIAEFKAIHQAAKSTHDAPQDPPIEKSNYQETTTSEMRANLQLQQTTPITTVATSTEPVSLPNSTVASQEIITPSRQPSVATKKKR